MPLSSPSSLEQLYEPHLGQRTPYFSLDFFLLLFTFLLWLICYPLATIRNYKSAIYREGFPLCHTQSIPA
ncbi:hypothetical protein ES702_05122 [subsurface metagenome]